MCCTWHKRRCFDSVVLFVAPHRSYASAGYALSVVGICVFPPSTSKVFIRMHGAPEIITTGKLFQGNACISEFGHKYSLIGYSISFSAIQRHKTRPFQGYVLMFLCQMPFVCESGIGIRLLMEYSQYSQLAVKTIGIAELIPRTKLFYYRAFLQPTFTVSKIWLRSNFKPASSLPDCMSWRRRTTISSPKNTLAGASPQQIDLGHMVRLSKLSALRQIYGGGRLGSRVSILILLRNLCRRASVRIP